MLHTVWTCLSFNGARVSDPGWMVAVGAMIVSRRYDSSAPGSRGCGWSYRRLADGGTTSFAGLMAI